MPAKKMYLLVAFFVFLIPQPGLADPLCPGDVNCVELGDAPEGGIAYPSLGINGMFPTCFGGLVGAIVHYNNTPEVWFGNSVDFETDGNDADCTWGLYERDEGLNTFDLDAGLVNTTTHTIFQNQVTPIGQQVPDPFGAPCTMVQWGADIDIWIQNDQPEPAEVNVLFDWDQSGDWGGESLCGGQGPTREHVVWNLRVPAYYVGLLSGLSPGDFLVGPNAGYVWARFTITNINPVPIPYDWNGGGDFDLGETEDYLLEIGGVQTGGFEMGDAPEEAMAYPGTMGHFPTCIATGPAGFIKHRPSQDVYFGQSLDFEVEGNHNLCNFIPENNDECTNADGDAGLIRPGSFTVMGSGSIQSCLGSTNDPLGDPCQTVSWGPDIDIMVTNLGSADRYLNVLADWTSNGRWGDFAGCGGLFGLESVLENFIIPAGFSGPLSQLSPPDFVILTNTPWVWFRFSLCDSRVSPGWDGSGEFGDGETEDYLLTVGRVSGVPVASGTSGRLLIEPAYPNPFNPSVRVAFAMARRQNITVTIHDAKGSLVKTLLSSELEAGQHELVWHGLDGRGRRQGSGVYLIRFKTDTDTLMQKVLMLK